MTEIGNTGSAQVVNLNPAPARAETSSSASHFSAAPVGQEKGNAAAATIVTQAGGTSPAQDPLQKAAKALEKFLPASDENRNTKLRIDRDEETGRFIYKNVDADTGEVLAQFPPAKILEIISYYREAEGLAVDSKA